MIDPRAKSCAGDSTVMPLVMPYSGKIAAVDPSTSSVPPSRTNFDELQQPFHAHAAADVVGRVLRAEVRRQFALLVGKRARLPREAVDLLLRRAADVRDRR